MTSSPTPEGPSSGVNHGMDVYLSAVPGIRAGAERHGLPAQADRRSASARDGHIARKLKQVFDTRRDYYGEALSALALSLAKDSVRGHGVMITRVDDLFEFTLRTYFANPREGYIEHGSGDTQRVGELFKAANLSDAQIKHLNKTFTSVLRRLAEHAGVDWPKYIATAEGLTDETYRSSEFTRKFFDLWAKNVPPDLGPSAQRFVNIIPTEGRVLDSGTGTARDLVMFLDHGIDAVGIDISESMLEEARVLHGEKLGERLELMNLVDLRFPDNDFDGVWDSAAFHHILSSEDTAHAIQEYLRVLKPGGTLFIRTNGGEGISMDNVQGQVRGIKLYTVEELTSFLRHHGFEILDAYVRPGYGTSGEAESFLHVFARKPEARVPHLFRRLQPTKARA